jgi:hypothetical protein
MKKIIVLIIICCQLGWAQNRNITAAEYFWGTIDPGNSNGTALTAQDGMFDEALESIIASYTNTQTAFGPILFNIRIKDANNQWGPTFKKVVFNLSNATEPFRQVNLTKFEYFFGNFDPGEGLGTTIITFDGALDEAVETVFRSQATWDIESGPILFNIRGKDSDGRWGPLFKKTVFPYGANPNVNLVQEGDAIQICPNTAITLNYAGPNGFTPTWFDGSQGQSITFTPTIAGDYNVTATFENTTYTDAINITFKPLPTATITPSGQVLVCASSNFNLVANTGTNLNYQWVLNGNNITGGTNANYLPTATGSYTVKVTDSSTGCLKTSGITVLSSSFIMSPNGTNSFCGSQLLSVPLGSSNSYKWKKEGVDISGANGNTYNATSAGSYTCVITNGSCSSTTSATILNTTSAPTGSSNQTFTSGQTLANLVINGANLQWYIASTGNTSIPNTTPLVSGTTYYVSQNVNGCEGPRLAVTVQVQLGIDDFNIFKIYYSPNPVKDFLYIKANEIIKNITVYNALGQLLINQINNNNDFRIDLSNLPSSNYIIKVETVDKKQVFNIIKQ